MKIRNIGRHQENVTLMMTPMIDVVFLLLIFFIMTFKIAAPEGDFNIRMPAASPRQSRAVDSDIPSLLKVRLTANPDGWLTGVYLAEARMNPKTPFKNLRETVMQFVGDDAGPGSIAEDIEVELDFDYNLRFEYVIDAITAISGKVEQGEIVKLIDKIKFAPTRKPIP